MTFEKIRYYLNSGFSFIWRQIQKLLGPKNSVLPHFLHGQGETSGWESTLSTSTTIYNTFIYDNPSWNLYFTNFEFLKLNRWKTSFERELQANILWMVIIL